MNDCQLLSLMHSSPHEGRRAFFEEYVSYVYAVTANKLRSVGSREDIEECVSDAFAELYRCIDKGLTGGDASLKALVSVVAKRKAIDTYRRLSSQSSPDTIYIDKQLSASIPGSDNIVRQSEENERNSILYKRIKELGEPDSSIIVQQFFYGRSARQIANSLEMSEAAVHKRSVRARGKLRKLLELSGIKEASL